MTIIYIGSVVVHNGRLNPFSGQVGRVTTGSKVFINSHVKFSQIIFVYVLHFLNSIFLSKRALLRNILCTHSLLEANSMNVFLLIQPYFEKGGQQYKKYIMNIKFLG